MTDCPLCLGLGEVVAGVDATGPFYAVCSCQPDRAPLPRCFKCRTPYCGSCGKSTCPCAEQGNNWECACDD